MSYLKVLILSVCISELNLRLALYPIASAFLGGKLIIDSWQTAYKKSGILSDDKRNCL